jgi:hypothetical protein
MSDFLIGFQITQPANGERRPFLLNATSKNGSTYVYLPRSFEGFMTLSSKNGSVVVSDAMSSRMITFSDVSSTLRCFVGGKGKWDTGGDEWSGDEVVASTCSGKVKVCYVDEVKTDKNWLRFLGM